MNINIKDMINLADKLDEQGLSSEASIIDNFLKIATKEEMHKCGLKQDSVNQHLELLEEYKKAAKEFETEYKKVFQSSNEIDSPNYGKLREIFRGQSYNGNSICLHNMYIEDVIESKPYSLEKSSQTESLIDTYYAGKCGAMLKEIFRAALTVRNGWVTLSFCLTEKSLYINTYDLHDIGVGISSSPVLAIDLWEHAYINDFGLDKQAYLNWFFSRLDWRNVGRRIKGLQNVKL